VDPNKLADQAPGGCSRQGPWHGCVPRRTAGPGRSSSGHLFDHTRHAPPSRLGFAAFDGEIAFADADRRSSTRFSGRGQPTP
jgi:hypothetical protein